jgi:hypothetical protein
MALYFSRMTCIKKINNSEFAVFNTLLYSTEEYDVFSQDYIYLLTLI